ncbi:hypothetical protein [Nostocoides sp. Soil756]|uniref:hypothetical protein n=1 Tax=Nostocoides sp. Soil756 TaxID=1736399 RepID=UPI0007156380|nr:hypothetical protein [Tetrasphaera sp. Soil756]KRE60027.1 hypothetical protein ASG78_14980 [Tetrasphaera sp. Soil756]
MTEVLDLFAGSGALRVALVVIGLASGAWVKWWVQHRHHEREHQEEDRRLAQVDRVLAMIERAAFVQPEAVEPLARLLSTPSSTARPVSHSLTSVGPPEESSPGNAA